MKSRDNGPGAQARAFKSDPARAKLLLLYAEVDALLAPFSCETSRECCHFGVTGREPYPTAVELAEVELAARAAGALGSRAPAKRRGRGLPLLTSPGVSAEETRPCPLLAADGRCRIYASRPFGCRTFFCERVTGPGKLPRDEIQRISRSIADLAARFDPRDPHARPLTRALERLAAGA